MIVYLHDKMYYNDEDVMIITTYNYVNMLTSEYQLKNKVR